MSEFYVDFRKLNQIGDELYAVRREIAQAADLVGQVAGSATIASMRYLEQPMQRQTEQIRTMENHADSLANAMRNIVDTYRSCEDSICNSGQRGSVEIENLADGGKQEAIRYGTSLAPESAQQFEIDSTLLKFLANAGVTGSALAMVGQLFTGATPAKTTLNFLKSGTKLWGNISDLALHSHNSFDWKRLFGLQDATTYKNFGDAFRGELDKLNFSKAKDVAGKSKVAAKWAGNFLTVVIKSYDNFHEGNSFWRSIGETIGESAVTIGETMAISAGVAALVGVAGVSLPAVVVGGATVAIKLGIDAVSQKLWQKDFAEAVSDFCLDNVVEPAGRAISGWWNKTTGDVKNFFSGGWKTAFGW